MTPGFNSLGAQPGYGQMTPDGQASPYGAAPFPTGEPTSLNANVGKVKAGRSYGSLIVICVLVLVLAAAVTFIVLKYRDKLGLGSIEREFGRPVAGALASTNEAVFDRFDMAASGRVLAARRLPDRSNSTSEYRS